MVIPVSETKYGVVVYDTDMNSFRDESFHVKNRRLPLQDYNTCELDSTIATVVGKDYDDKKYIISFGDNILYSVDKKILLSYSVSNIRIKDGKIKFLDGKPADLGNLFPDKNIKFIGGFNEVQTSVLGLSKKFYGLYNGKPCIVKFSKLGSNEDIENEILYKKLADILNVPCCETFESIYCGKPCCISLFAYNPTRDCFRSFKSTCTDLDSIMCKLDYSSKVDLDKILILDYLVNQQDRHMSNIAMYNGRLYPAFDNGECFNLSGVGYFSLRFRHYVERLDKKYVYNLLRYNINEIKNVLPLNKFNIFYQNYKNLLGGM